MPLWKRIALVGAVGAAAIVAAGFIALRWWLYVDPVDADWPAARVRFEAVLNGDLANEQHAIASLAGALERQPDHALGHLWFGLANMHAFLRHRELPAAIRAARALHRAVELDPADASAEGWRAFFAYQAARARGSDLDAARTALLGAADADPRFTPFLAAVALAPLPISTGYPERMLRLLETIEDCGDGTSHSCRTSTFFPHGAEGFYATLGDLRVRLGDVPGGRRAYARALQMPGAARWPYRQAFEAWMDGAEVRAALLINDDVEDDPKVFFASGPRACAACHERSLPVAETAPGG